MCCPTGLCGVSVDPELIRLATIITNLTKKRIIVERFNLSSSPDRFIAQEKVKELLNKEGMNCLPITILDGNVKITRRYLYCMRVI